MNNKESPAEKKIETVLRSRRNQVRQRENIKLGAVAMLLVFMGGAGGWAMGRTSGKKSIDFTNIPIPTDQDMDKIVTQISENPEMKARWADFVEEVKKIDAKTKQGQHR